MGWDELRFFHSLAEHGNLERAARQLGVGVGTVHRRVATLEAELGVRLFVRAKTGHSLTDAGQVLHARSTEVNSIFNDVRHQLGNRDGMLSGPVRVTTTQSAADYILLPRVAAFRRKHPSVSLELEALPEIVSLIDERPSVALRFRRPQRGHVTVRRLGALSCSLFASAELAETIDGFGGQRTLRDLPYVGWTREFRDIGLARELSTWFAGPPAVAVGSMNGQLSAALAGIGVAHLPRFVAQSTLGLVDLRADEQTMSLEAWLVTPLVLRHVRRVAVVTDFVADAVLEHL